jgi:hypothetical protein
LNGEIIDYGSDTGDLGGVRSRERAGCFAADVAGEGGDAILNGGLYGFGAEGAVTGDAALQRCGEGGVVDGWSCGLGPAAGGADGENYGC